MNENDIGIIKDLVKKEFDELTKNKSVEMPFVQQTKTLFEKIAGLNSPQLNGTFSIKKDSIFLSGKQIAIDGNTTFSNGYDPTDKVDGVGGSYDSASSGARVRIFPDANTGILATDGTNDILKVLVGGVDVGDVVIGDEANNNYVKWDASEGSLNISGKLGSSDSIRMGDDNDNITLHGEHNRLEIQLGGDVKGWFGMESGWNASNMLFAEAPTYSSQQLAFLYNNGNGKAMYLRNYNSGVETLRVRHDGGGNAVYLDKGFLRLAPDGIKTSTGAIGWSGSFSTGGGGTATVQDGIITDVS